MGVVEGCVLAIGARPAQLPWLLWPEHLIVITQAIFDPLVWCMHLALSRLICKSCFIEHLFSQKLWVLHTNGFYVPLQVLFLVLWPRQTLGVSLSSPIKYILCNLSNSFYFSYNLDRCVLELFKQSLKSQSLNYY